MSPFATIVILAVASVLLVDSGVGLVLLVSSLSARDGLGAMAEAWQSFGPWYLLPGVLGSFFVFASILGYQRVGAAVTISTRVASQLVADGLRSGQGGLRIEPASLLGHASCGA